MKLERLNIVVRIESESGEAKLHFHPLPRNIKYKHISAAKPLLKDIEESKDKEGADLAYLGAAVQELNFEREQAIFKSCYEIEGAFDYSLEDVQIAAIDDITAEAILTGYNVALELLSKSEADEKNEETAADL